MKPPPVDGADILEALGVDTYGVASAAIVFKAGEPPQLTLVQWIPNNRRTADIRLATEHYELRHIGDEQ